MSWTNKLYTFIVDAFRPPFRTSHWIALGYVILSIIYNPNSNFNRWVLPDTDDYTRFVQVFNWLDGHSWFDLTLPRLYPEHVISMHWARLVDIPLAGMLVLLQGISSFFQWDTERQGLAMLTAMIVPCVLLAFMLLLVRALARPLVGKRYAGLACYFVPLAMQLVFQFAPMRVDHHAYILLFSGFTFLCLQRIALNLKPLRMAALAGLSFALAMWNGAEVMPAIIAFTACLTLTLLFNKKRNALVAPVFGASLLAATFIILLLAIAPAQRWDIAFDTFSFFYVILAAYTCGFCIILGLLLRFVPHRGLSFSAAFFAALSLLSHLLSLFPDFIGGPYARANPLLQDLFLSNIREAVPFIRAWADLKDNFGAAPNQAIGGAIYFLTTRLFAPVLGTLTALTQLFAKNAARTKQLWMLYAFFCLFYFGLAMFWQVRVIGYAQLFAIPPMLWLMLRYLKTLPKHYAGRSLFGWEMLTVLSFTILPTVVVPSIILQSKMNPDMMFFLGTSTNMPCMDSTRVVAWLRGLEKDEKKTSVIMTQMDYAPELMFWTNHSFIAAPYHRNDRGIIDMVMFFRSKGDDAPARGIAKRDELDYVLVCKTSYFQGTLDSKHEVKNLVVNVGKGGNTTMRPDEKEIHDSSLGFRLTYDVIPHWLETVDIPMESHFALFKVKKDRLSKPTTYPKIKKEKDGN